MNRQRTAPHFTPPHILVVAALVCVQVLFGINYLCAKVIVGAVPPLVWASLKMIVVVPVMFAFAFFSKRPHPRMDRNFLGGVVAFSLFGIVFNQLSFLFGLRLTTPTNAAILNTLIPIFTILVVTLRGQEPLTLLKGLGFILALTGVLLLQKVESLQISDSTFRGDILVILNCLSYAIFLSISKPFFSRVDPVWATAWLFLSGGVCLTVLALPSYQDFVFPVLTYSLGFSMAFAILGATLASYFLNFWALSHTRSSHVALFIYLQPVVAMLIAWFLQGQAITARTLASSALIFLGLLLGLRRVSVRAPLAENFQARVAIQGSEFALVDLSAHGFSALVPESFATNLHNGDVSQVEIRWPPSLRISASAETTSLAMVKAGVRIGFRFLDVSSELARQIDREVHQARKRKLD
ncbi:MAG: EamA family transporter [Bdellovibrionota bacterium]